MSAGNSGKLENRCFPFENILAEFAMHLSLISSNSTDKTILLFLGCIPFAVLQLPLFIN